MEQIHVVEVVESAAYGTGKHVAELCRALPALGFRTTLIASTARGNAFRETMQDLETAGVRCIELDMRRQVNPWADLRALIRLRRLFRELAPTIVHGHGSKAGFLARMAAHTLGIHNTVYTPHCFAFAAGERGMRERFYRSAERRAGRWTARLIAVSSYEAGLAERARIVPRERVIVIPNGLSDDAMERIEAPAALAAELGLRPDERVIGFVGRLWRQKGLDLLIPAFARVARQVPECRLLLVGDGPEEHALRELARTEGVSRQVSFAGWRQQPRRTLALMNVFVLPSRWESAPYALLEAMAWGMPIVASRVGGVPETLDGGSCGKLVAPNSPEELAEAILSILNNPAGAARMAQAARERVRTCYRLSASVAQTANLYHELADSKA